jgi:RNA polymerase sigma-70 factor (sigma-E family)
VDDDRSFVMFVRAHYGDLYRTAALLTGNSASAEDLVQETLTRLYPIWARVARTDHPVAYVRRSLTNRFLTLRRRLSATELVTAVVPEGLPANDPSDEVIDRHVVLQLLGQLSERQRAAVVMRFLHDMTDQEIAASIGCRKATARSLVGRAITSMRRHSDRMHGVDNGVESGSPS